MCYVECETRTETKAPMIMEFQSLVCVFRLRYVGWLACIKLFIHEKKKKDKSNFGKRILSVCLGLTESVRQIQSSPPPDQTHPPPAITNDV